MAFACLLAAVPLSALAGALPKRAPGRPAVWRTYDMIVDLNDLSRTYTCDDLWYVFHGILLRLGAPISSLSVLPNRCSRTRSGDLRSPRVEVHFQMPSVVRGAAVKWATLSAVRRRVPIRPGEPRTLKASDCRLLRQIRDTLLDSLPVQVVRTDLDCAPGARFGLTVRAWVADSP